MITYTVRIHCEGNHEQWNKYIRDIVKRGKYETRFNRWHRKILVERGIEEWLIHNGIRCWMRHEDRRLSETTEIMPYGYVTIVLEFRKDSDAVLFKLRWADQIISHEEVAA